MTKLKPQMPNAPPVSSSQPPNPRRLQAQIPLHSPVSSSRLQPQIQPMEEGDGMARRRSPPLHPQIQAREEGGGMASCSSPRLHPQIHASEDGAGVTRLGTSPVESASLPDDDDMLREILLRLPPQPSSLPRASVVCKRWRGLVTDPKFHRQFRAHHGKPPLLGLFQMTYHGIVFKPILDPPDRIPTQRFDLGRYSQSHLLDCRHGLVLVKDYKQNEVVVCDPITADQRCVAVPSELRTGYLKGAVLCAAGDGHVRVHGSCHSNLFKVILVSTSDNQPLACVYSSETVTWSNLISAKAPCQFSDGVVPPTLIGSALYWLSSAHILEFDLDEHILAVIMDPPFTDDLHIQNRQIFQAENGAVGFAILLDPGYQFQIWQRNVNGPGVATWMPWKTIDLHTFLGLPSQIEVVVGWLLGYDEDSDEIFLHASGNIYGVQLKLMQSRKLYKTIFAIPSYPFKSFYTPAIHEGDEADIGRLSLV